MSKFSDQDWHVVGPVLGQRLYKQTTKVAARCSKEIAKIQEICWESDSVQAHIGIIRLSTGIRKYDAYETGAQYIGFDIKWILCLPYL